MRQLKVFTLYVVLCIAAGTLFGFGEMLYAYYIKRQSSVGPPVKFITPKPAKLQYAILRGHNDPRVGHSAIRIY